VVGPAGSISSSATELTNWLQMHLNYGVFNGKRLVSANSLLETYKPAMFQPTYSAFPEPIFPASLTIGAYAQGWWIGTYRGHEMLQHGGNTFGHSALNVLFPLDGLGMSILTNMNGLGIPHLLLTMYAFDLLNGYQPWLNSTNTCNFPCDWVKCGAEDIKFEESSQLQQKEIVVDTKDYVGNYNHPSYGTVQVYQGVGQFLNFTWNNLVGYIVPQATDTFLAEAFTPVSLIAAKIPVQFARTSTGAIDSTLLLLEPTVPPIVFTNQHFVPKDCGFPKFQETVVQSETSKIY